MHSCRHFYLDFLAICYATWICVLRSSQPLAGRYKRSRHSTASSTNHVFTVKEILSFPQNYHAKGVLSLPYGNIVEPFEAWYSGEHKMSRIDYYGGKSISCLKQFN